MFDSFSDTICPFMSGAWNPRIRADQSPDASFGEANLLSVKCLKEKCQLWIPMVWSTEGFRQEGRCALRFLGEKNEEGKLPV